MTWCPCHEHRELWRVLAGAVAALERHAELEDRHPDTPSWVKVEHRVIRGRIALLLSAVEAHFRREESACCRSRTGCCP